MLPSPKSPQPVTSPELGVGHLGLAGLAAQLTRHLDHVIESPVVALGEEATVGVHRVAPAELDPTVAHELPGLSRAADAQGLQLDQHHVAEAVVDPQEIHVPRPDPRHLEGPGCGEAQPHPEGLGPARDVVGREGTSLGSAHDQDRGLGEIPSALGRGDHDGGRAVGLERAVVEAEGLGDPARLQVLLHAERPAAHQGLRVQLGVAATGQGHVARRLVRDAVELLVAHADPRVELNRQHGAVGQVEVQDLIGGGRRSEREPGLPRTGPGRSAEKPFQPTTTSTCLARPFATATAALWSAAMGLAPPMWTVTA